MDKNIDHKAKKQKSPNYPSLNLEEAIGKAKILFDKDGKAGAPKKVALEHLGYKVESGASARTLSALRKFDLITDVGGRIVPSQRAIDLLVYPKDSEKYSEALKYAALNPRIYSTLWSEYSNGFPSDAALKAELIDKHNFNRNQVEGFLRDFKRTIEFAGLAHDDEIPKGDEVSGENVKVDPPAKGLRIFSWPLSKEVSAEVRLSGPEVKPSHIERLRQYLDLAKSALENETE